MASKAELLVNQVPRHHCRRRRFLVENRLAMPTFKDCEASGGCGARLSLTTLTDTKNLATTKEGGSVYFVVDHVAIRRYAAGH